MIPSSSWSKNQSSALETPSRHPKCLSRARILEIAVPIHADDGTNRLAFFKISDSTCLDAGHQGPRTVAAGLARRMASKTLDVVVGRLNPMNKTAASLLTYSKLAPSVSTENSRANQQARRDTSPKIIFVYIESTLQLLRQEFRNKIICRDLTIYKATKTTSKSSLAASDMQASCRPNLGRQVSLGSCVESQDNVGPK